MSYQIPADKAKQFQVNGRTYCIAALSVALGPIESFIVGVFELRTDGWAMLDNPVVNLPSGVLAEMQKAGGQVKYFLKVKAALQALLNKIFGGAAVPSPAPSTSEPTDDATAAAAITAAVMGWNVTVVNGVPVIQ